MEELNKDYNLKEIDIKSNNVMKSKILSIIDSRETLDILINKNVIETYKNSIKKIFNFSKINLEEYIFYINKNDMYHQSDDKTIYNPIQHEIGTLYGKGNLPKPKEIESDPLIRKIDSYLPYIYFIIGSILLIHLLLFLFSPQFEINVYVFTCLILAEDLLSLGYFYYEKDHFIDSFTIHQKYIPFFLMVACFLCFVDIIYITLTSNPMLKTFRQNNTFISFIAYLFSFALTSFGTFYEFIFIKKRKKYQILQEVKNESINIEQTQEVKIS